MDKKAVKMGIICICILLFFINTKIKQDKVYLNLNENEMYASPLLWKENSFEEVFYVDHDMSLCLQIRPVTWNYEHKENEVLEVKLKKANGEEIIKTHTFHANNLPDNMLMDYIFFDNVKLEKDEWYHIILESNIADKDRGIAFMCTEKAGENSYALIDKEQQPYNFSMIIYE